MSCGLHIVACLKQVPHAQDLKIDPERGTLIRTGARVIINPPDENACEVALQLKDKHGGKITAITMGPPQSDVILKEMIARGFDDAILICDRPFAGADTYPTSLTLARAIQKIGEVDLVVTGEETTDSSTGHVGPGIAAHLNLAQATYIDQIDWVPQRGVFRARRAIEGGFVVVEFPPPGLISASLNMNNPRVPALSGKMKAQKYTLPVWTLANLDVPAEWVGLKGSPTIVAKVVADKGAGRKAQMINGGPAEAAAKLLELLKQRGALQ